MKSDLLDKLEKNAASLSKGQKKIADYIMKNYDKAAFMTASVLGKKVGTSESTVVRFASELGFKGYPELQKELQQLIKSKLTAVQRLEVSRSLIGDGDIVGTVLSGDMELIRQTAEEISKEDFKKSVEAINNAKKIYILGVRSSAALASFLAFYFNLVFDSVVLVDTSSNSEMFEQMFRIDENDVCIAISFPRYSRQTVNAIRFIHDRKATVISVTDTVKSPIAPFSDYLLVAKSSMASVVDSLVAPLSLINALIVSVTLSKKDEIYGNFNKLESIWDKYQVYEKDEINPDE